MGGYDGACDLSSCEMYNPALNKWMNITAMGTKRSCLGVGSNNGLIYCVGGECGRGRGRAWVWVCVCVCVWEGFYVCVLGNV